MTGFEIGSREWSLRFPEDAPDLPGTTSGMKVATIRPERLTFTEYPRAGGAEVRASAEGRKVRADGTLTDAYVKVTVGLTGRDFYAPAPEWVHVLWAQVRIEDQR